MGKQVLGIKQMQKLKKLGVDTSKASMVLIYYNENGEEVGWDVEDHGADSTIMETYDSEYECWNSARPEYLDAETGNYDHSYREECGVFTLQDIIDVMPKQIDNYNIVVLAYCDDIAYVDSNKNVLMDFVGTDLLQSGFYMLCALAEKGYLKTK